MKGEDILRVIGIFALIGGYVFLAWSAYKAWVWLGG